MPRRLPPLTSLRAFEAAGRHLSFTKAAAELAVTQAAISHQVKSLEENLGKPLFLRLPRHLELTGAGKTLLPVVRRAFDQVAQAVAGLTDDVLSSAVTVRLAPTFAAKWLSPRLEGFRKKYPHIDLSLTHSNEAADFSNAAIDLAVTYGKGKWRGVVADRVFGIDFFPVCAPGYMRGDHPLTELGNLQYHTLLHDSDHRNWSAWLELSDAKNFNPKRGTIFDDTNVLIQAAVNGLGIALGSTPFVTDHLESGRLVRPFDTTLHSDFAYYVVSPKKHLKRPAVRAFREWLLEQASIED